MLLKLFKNSYMLLSKEVFFEEYVERIEKMVKGEPMSQETISTSL